MMLERLPAKEVLLLCDDYHSAYFPVFEATRNGNCLPFRGSRRAVACFTGTATAQGQVPAASRRCRGTSRPRDTRKISSTSCCFFDKITLMTTFNPSKRSSMLGISVGMLVVFSVQIFLTISSPFARLRLANGERI